MATKIRNTAKTFHAPSLPQPPAEYSQALTHQRDTTLRIYFQNIDEALTKALQYDTSDIIDGSIPNSKLENSTVSFGGVTLSLGGSDATPAFDLSDATGYPTSSLVGTITNAQLAGSITNAKLVNDSVSYGGVSLDLGQTDATPAFDLSDATNYPTSSLSGTITNAQLAGSIENAKLSNSTVSYGGVQLALGASDATPAFDLSDATNYPTSSLSGTIATAQIADDAVTTAKLADSINSAITANTAKVTNATHTGEVTGATALTIADGAVVTARIADDAVTQAKIANNAIGSDQIASGAVIAGKLQTSSVASSNIQSNAVTTVKINADAVTNAKIADDAVDTAQIADDAVTAAKLADTYLTSTLSADIDADDNSIVNLENVFIGGNPSSSSSFDLYVEGSKSSEESDLIRVKNTNTSTSADGRIMAWYSGSNFRGSVGYTDVIYGSGGFFAGTGCGLLATTQFSTHIVSPINGSGDFRDNQVDLGQSSARFDDIFATNSTINTSDRNEKQDIQAVTDAERRVATAVKALMRRFRWQDAVAEKGDDARLHFGVIAQDLEAAFTAEGLDANDYAMFCSNTWWEHDGNIYNEQAHIPDGVTATEVTRRGVRYSELLAFIITAL